MSTYFDPACRIKALITPQTISLEAVSDPSKWKSPYLDLDILAKLYAHSLLYNDSKGKEIVQSFNQWSPFKHFTSQILASVQNIIQYQHSFIEKYPLQQANILALMTCLINRLSNGTAPAYTHRLTQMLAIFQNKAHYASTEQQEWNGGFHTFLKRLINQKPHGIAVIKELTQLADKDRYVKNFYRTYFYRGQLARILSGPGSLLPREIVEEIAQYWYPDYRFIKFYFPNIIPQAFPIS